MKQLWSWWTSRRRELAYKQLGAERGTPPGHERPLRTGRYDIDTSAHTTTEWKGD